MAIRQRGARRYHANSRAHPMPIPCHFDRGNHSNLRAAYSLIQWPFAGLSPGNTMPIRGSNHANTVLLRTPGAIGALAELWGHETFFDSGSRRRYLGMVAPDWGVLWQANCSLFKENMYSMF